MYSGGIGYSEPEMLLQLLQASGRRSHIFQFYTSPPFYCKYLQTRSARASIKLLWEILLLLYHQGTVG